MFLALALCEHSVHVMDPAIDRWYRRVAFSHDDRCLVIDATPVVGEGRYSVAARHAGVRWGESQLLGTLGSELPPGRRYHVRDGFTVNGAPFVCIVVERELKSADDRDWTICLARWQGAKLGWASAADPVEVSSDVASIHVACTDRGEPVLAVDTRSAHLARVWRGGRWSLLANIRGRRVSVDPTTGRLMTWSLSKAGLTVWEASSVGLRQIGPEVTSITSEQFEYPVLRAGIGGQILLSALEKGSDSEVLLRLSVDGKGWTRSNLLRLTRKERPANPAVNGVLGLGYSAKGTLLVAYTTGSKSEFAISEFDAKGQEIGKTRKINHFWETLTEVSRVEIVDALGVLHVFPYIMR